MRIVMCAPFDVYSGYGNDAVDMAIGLTKEGVDVVPFPTRLLPGLPTRFVQLLVKDPDGPKDLVFQFTDPVALAAGQLKHYAPKRVGYSMWERNPLTVDDFDVSGVPPEYQTPESQQRLDRVRDRRAFEDLDLLMVTCTMNEEAFRAVDADTPIRVQPCGIDGKKWEQQDRAEDRPFTFIDVGALGGRKNPFALLEAWKELKAEHPDFDARLHLHTTKPGLHPGITEGAYGPDISLSERPLNHASMLAMYADADVFVSTSRGEGNNKPPMEFMATGGPVIATDWSGHQNWLTRDVGWAVGGTLQPAKGNRDAVEFEVDRDELKATMLRAYENRGETRRRGRNAASFIRTAYDWPVVCKRIAKTFEEVVYG